MATIMPYYNKLTYDGTTNIPGYGYPLVASFLQVAAVSILLLTWNVLKHFLWDKDKQEDSWIFGDKFLTKLYPFSPSVTVLYSKVETENFSSFRASASVL